MNRSKSLPTKSIFSYLNKNIIKKFNREHLWIIDQWKLIEQMRNLEEAPVDTMGVTKCSDKSESSNTYKYQTLISLILSSQTKDETTFSVMSKLIKFGLNLETISNLSIPDIEELIHGVNFHKNKAKYIKGSTLMIKEKFGGVPPSNLPDTLKLPGVGQKMGNLYMQTCFGINTGIAVDTHVHRITNKLRWINDCKTPEISRKELQKIFPEELWDSINTLLVGFGQTICKAVKPLCEKCLLNTTCEYGILKLKEGSKKKSKRSKQSMLNMHKETINTAEIEKGLSLTNARKKVKIEYEKEKV